VRYLGIGSETGKGSSGAAPLDRRLGTRAKPKEKRGFFD